MKNLICCFLISVVVYSCSNAPQYNDPIPPHDNFKIESTILNETRVINVWTPPNYKTSTDSLPVIYMPDGGIVMEDFPHIANTISKLVENKSIDPIILVGIENIDRRKDLSGASEVKADEEYCPLTDGAKDFRAFIKEELMVDINSKYRTMNETGIIGESLAGLFVMETFLLNPDTFDFYIAMDPSLWWNDHYLERNSKRYLENSPSKVTRLWFAGSDAETISIHANNLARTLETNAPKELLWKYSDEPKEQHNTIFRATKEKALIWILNADAKDGLN
ncbi:putative esterase [Winogradskyella psychrotolerans RS-3]|uniref:Putative esterase n=1 Tax=Winogradskyella psychrotolerans RS-3 TaxID=641526 RepID=S7VLE9_9FLAO|nr:alpha/beta hydrolase-fold protein [Winogradskyella psychrotolerans]EPR70711.1 putative esterase [Winogradskyella psychrotolerans RS-3]